MRRFAATNAATGMNCGDVVRTGVHRKAADQQKHTDVNCCERVRAHLKKS
jgi:hypothetical protein